VGLSDGEALSVGAAVAEPVAVGAGVADGLALAVSLGLALVASGAGTFSSIEVYPGPPLPSPTGSPQ